MTSLPTYADVEAAAARIAGVAHKTPVLTSTTADQALGCKLFFKAENFQRMGAFKFRGGYNSVAKFTPEQKKTGVVAYSSGNHAQAVALAAKILGVPAVIVMPHDAPAAKVAATKGYGAEVVSYDRYSEDREAIGAKLSAERGLTIIPPYNHPDVIAGQGTAAKELIEEVGPLDYVFAPVGGGGLISGTALSAKALCPDCKVIGVEPAAGNDAQRSLAEGRIVHIDTPKTIADGAQTQHIGDLTYTIMKYNLAEIRTATDAELIEAMGFFATRMKIVVEPTGCLGFAAAKQIAPALAGKRVGIILSGGNVDMTRFCELLAG